MCAPGVAEALRIVDAEIFHVTVSAPYKVALVAGQEIVAGETHNPFFGFYESPRTYPVLNSQGEVVQCPAIALLRAVSEGVGYPNFPAIALEVAKHYQMLARELLMEQVRLEHFSHLPSRQSCLFGAETLEEARYWVSRLMTPGAVICRLAATGSTHRADARLLLADSEPLSQTITRAKAYWRGERSDRPEMKTLFAGRATVLEVGL